MISRNLHHYGANFLGVFVGHCPSQYKETVFSSLKRYLKECVLDERRIYVHDLSGKISDENIVRNMIIYRNGNAHSYNLPLIDVGDSDIDLGNFKGYCIDFEAFLEYEVHRLKADIAKLENNFL